MHRQADPPENIRSLHLRDKFDTNAVAALEQAGYPAIAPREWMARHAISCCGSNAKSMARCDLSA